MRCVSKFNLSNPQLLQPLQRAEVFAIEHMPEVHFASGSTDPEKAFFPFRILRRTPSDFLQRGSDARRICRANPIATICSKIARCGFCYSYQPRRQYDDIEC